TRCSTQARRASRSSARCGLTCSCCGAGFRCSSPCTFMRGKALSPWMCRSPARPAEWRSRDRPKADGARARSKAAGICFPAPATTLTTPATTLAHRLRHSAHGLQHSAHASHSSVRARPVDACTFAAQRRRARGSTGCSLASDSSRAQSCIRRNSQIRIAMSIGPLAAHTSCRSVDASGNYQLWEPGVQILVCAEDAARAALIEEALAESADTEIRPVVHRIERIASLLPSVAATNPDVIVVDLREPSPERISLLTAAATAIKRPIVAFVDHSDAASARKAIDAGVAAYVVDGLA